jgi:hypothetical protein
VVANHLIIVTSCASVSCRRCACTLATFLRARRKVVGCKLPFEDVQGLYRGTAVESLLVMPRYTVGGRWVLAHFHNSPAVMIVWTLLRPAGSSCSWLPISRRLLDVGSEARDYFGKFTFHLSRGMSPVELSRTPEASSGDETPTITAALNFLCRSHHMSGAERSTTQVAYSIMFAQSV